MKQEPYASTLMSSVKLAYDYYNDTPIETSLLFGLSGHAFIIHITNGLGPCAPYTFDGKEFSKLCENGLGLSLFNDEKLVLADHSEKQKKEASEFFKNVLDDKELVLLASYEYQILYAAEEKFLVSQPWEDAPVLTSDLDFQTLEGMKEFMTAFRVKNVTPIELRDSILNSLRYAINLLEDPEPMLDSGFDINAYEFWLDKINGENGIGHGNWWTSTVWAESRKIASLYMLDIKEFIDNPVLDELSSIYLYSSELLTKIADKENKVEDKINWIKELKENELKTLPLLKELV